VPAHNAGHGRQPKPAAGEFRREKGVEDSGFGGVVHAAAGVAHFQTNIWAGGQLRRFRMAPGVLLVHVLNAGLDRDQAVIAADRFDRVQRQVREHLLHLAAIGFDGRQVRLEIEA
jgi:hypothetical protein